MEVYTIHFESLDSTNTWAKKNVHTFDPTKMTCIIADIQTAGRGCFDKHWISTRGNLTMSVFFHIDSKNLLLPYIAQLFTYSTYKVLQKEGVATQIKWPNDLLAHGKKLCGVLAETVQGGVVIGVGMNVNVPVETNQPTTSLIELTGREWDLNQLTQQIIAEFQKDLQLDFSEFQECFNTLVSGKTIKSG